MLGSKEEVIAKGFDDLVSNTESTALPKILEEELTTKEWKW